MAAAGASNDSLRAGQADLARLTRAFVVSVALHLLLFGTYYTGKRLNWWENLSAPNWFKRPVMLTEVLKRSSPKTNAVPQISQEPPLVFVDVSPSVATDEAPPNAKFYSDKNSRAANREPDRETGAPRLAGKQENIIKTQDVPREEYKPLQKPAPSLKELAKAAPEEPIPFAAPPSEQPQEEQPPKPWMEVGDLALGKPEPVTPREEGQAKAPRPRTVKEAMARKNIAQLPGEKMKQEGGVGPRLAFDALDAKATPFGAYDAALIEAISQRWYSLLDQRNYASDSRGRVILQFRLHYDGRITDMNIAENTAGEMLGFICMRAVQEPSPFAPWPLEMRRMLGETRRIQFTFYYN